MIISSSVMQHMQLHRQLCNICSRIP